MMEISGGKEWKDCPRTRLIGKVVTGPRIKKNPLPIPTRVSRLRHRSVRLSLPIGETPEGLPIDIFIFGGRRSGVVPLVAEAFDWDHGVFMGATAASEPTAAILDNVGIRYDPFAMLPFCGYNMADYFQHWFDMGDKLKKKAPKIFYVNWFRKSSDGKFLWPGFRENSRALKWMCERVDDKVGAKKDADRVFAER